MLTPIPAVAGMATPYGAAVHLHPFRNDPNLKRHLVEHTDVVVPMNALKWASLRYEKRRFDFSGADEIIEFAEKNKKTIHGHALLWYHANPAWLDAVRSPVELENLLADHIEKVVGRYAGRIKSWDVVNEVVAHDPVSQGLWRGGVWYDVLGPRHVEIAFRLAAQADPKTLLFINDYDLEDDSLRTLKRQQAILSIVRNLQDKNIPIYGVGLQAHLYAERQIGIRNLQKFLKSLKAMGLVVSITELDVIDWKLPRNIMERDRLVAAKAEEFLDTVHEVVKPQMITSWGMNDAYSWIQEVFPRDDGAMPRPLPFDVNWKVKPLFETIRRFSS